MAVERQVVPTVHACGRRGVLVEYPDDVSAQAAYDEAVRRRSEGWLPELDDMVPGARTVLFDGVDHPQRLGAEIASWQLMAVPPLDGPIVELPTVYDGPDLGTVAGFCGLTVGDVVELHSGAAHRVAFCGFSPGFAYISGNSLAHQIPRREQPRSSVPSGAVALAGEMTGVYPRPSPGGWQIIGRTDAELWDPQRNPPALLTPGVQVRFRAVRR